MTDRELLELAAKAAGYEIHWQAFGDGKPKMCVKSDIWNPLTKDDDALRLVVKLKLGVASNDNDTWAWAMCNSTTECCNEERKSNPEAATRRAIVRAAAQIGRAMP